MPISHHIHFPKRARPSGLFPGGLGELCVKAVFAILLLFLPACHPTAPSAPLPQRGYLWQRDWTPTATSSESPVLSAFHEAQDKMDGLVLLGAEIRWSGSTPEIIKANIPWAALRNSPKPISLALRVAPFPGPFAENDATARTIADTAHALVREAATHGIKLAEFQLDFDCAQKKLAGYRAWLGAVRRAVQPLPLVLTTLPSWLDEPDFVPLVRAADGYVLQVHSVPTTPETGHASLCDPALARKWVQKASRLGLPFSIALPTYRCLAGYAPDGKLLGVAMDSVKPPWPPDTRLLEFATNADEVAGLVRDWLAAPPPGLRGLLWYRVPVATDQFNWRWPTLRAVMAGRNPAHHLEVIPQGDNPIDLAIINSGEADEPLDCTVNAAWDGAPLAASDSLAGWSIQVERNLATFNPDPGLGARLPPGARRSIGWLRYDQVTPLRLKITPSHD